MAFSLSTVAKTQAYDQDKSSASELVPVKVSVLLKVINLLPLLVLLTKISGLTSEWCLPPRFQSTRNVYVDYRSGNVQAQFQ